MEGIILVDKPVGPTSFDVVKKLRKLSGQKRIGHAGTLDPLASGLMVICLGRYTKLAGILTDADKIYDATITLGVATSTDDGEGEIIAEKDGSHLSALDISNALQQFIGPIMQAPPRFSAIKINGKRAYSMARAEQDFQLAKRPVEIFSITMLEYMYPHIKVRIHCAKGTYIRSLARDVGEALGACAHASAIRRIQSARLRVLDAVALDGINSENLSARLTRGVQACAHLETLVISPFQRDELRFGRNACKEMPLKSEVAIALCDDEPIAIMRNNSGFAAIARVV